MPTLSRLPVALAGVGGLLGATTTTPDAALLGLAAGYLVGKFLQSLAWTMTGPPDVA